MKKSLRFVGGVVSLAALLFAAELVQLVQEVEKVTVPAVLASEPMEAEPRGSVLDPVPGLSPEVLRLATSAVQCAAARGDIEPPKTLTVIDYSLPSVERRLWVFDLRRRVVLYNELVAHGRNTGENMSVHFSDTLNSRQSSIGLFVTNDTYVGSNGYSLRLDGLEPGFNGRARERAIVMHGAPYVDPGLAATQGRIGRSWGCPALREAIARDVIDTIRGGGVIFSYYPDANWLKSSRYLNDCGATTTTT
jgi:hypothetical protein